MKIVIELDISSKDQTIKSNAKTSHESALILGKIMKVLAEEKLEDSNLYFNIHSK